MRAVRVRPWFLSLTASLWAAVWLAACGDVVVAEQDRDVAAGSDGGGAVETGGAADTGGAPGTPVSCAEYCGQVIAACGTEGPTAQYASEAQCRLYCESWAGLPLGTTTDVEGNTAGCRLYHATVAGTVDPEQHCLHAGPTGAEHCGTWCEKYCHLALRNCTGDNQLYADEAACLAACGGFRNDGAPGDREGNTVQCRIRALGLAGAEPPATADQHCPSGGADGGEVCIDRPTCAQYCDVVTEACAEQGHPQYPSREACLAYCEQSAGLPAGTLDDTAGNTIGCRIYHATVASATTPEEHCTHSGPTGADVCGTWCENYCFLAMRNCRDANRLFPSAEECLEQCAPVPDDGEPGAETGNTIQCRIFRLGLAGEDPPDSANVHCAEGSLHSTVCQ